MERIYLNDDWMFNEEFDEKMISNLMKKGESVRVPHTVKELPLHYFDEHEYQMLSAYQRNIKPDKKWKGKRLLLTFDAIGHDSTVYVNGERAGEHHCGYTAFTVDITDYVKLGKDNLITVKVDSRENLNVPPFGFVIDYMTYGGIYRDVYLDVKESSYIEDVFVSTKQADKDNQRCRRSQTISEVKINEPKDDMVIRQSFRRKGEEEYQLLTERKLIDISRPKLVEENEFGEITVAAGLDIAGGDAIISTSGETGDISDFKEVVSNSDNSVVGNTSSKLTAKATLDVADGSSLDTTYTFRATTGNVTLWDIDNPALYELKTELIENGEVIDEKVTTYGYRKAVFKKNGFYLNGRKVKIRGLNRHQSYPYVGYAMPESMQKNDADILKYELGLNAVRTSHYPQSHYFLDRCDEIGLLVFTEFPGWQHIGDDDWKAQAVENVKDMIVQYRNHTSIVLWGVRINESVDDDEFYEETNAVAHAFDTTRPTGGVRCYKKSSFLEDVYTYNDFLHSGDNKGCDKKSAVTPDVERPYLISEYMGHMYPTKAFDTEEHRAEHAIRHANVLNEVNKQKDISGAFGWCMFDYNTHKDFGSGDRICYHGVMDMFRNPKLAAYVYASQQEESPVLELSSAMDIGEHPGCNRGETYIFTNADSVRMYKNDYFIKEYTAENSDHPYMEHPPIKIDDYIGDLLETKENMPHAQAEEVKAILNEVAKVGLYNMSKITYAKAGKMMLLYNMKMDDAVALYNKYIGDWGGESTVYRFEAIKDGEVVKTITKAPMTKVNLVLTADHTDLIEKNSYDVAAVRITAQDEYGNQLPFYNDAIALKINGDAELIGPKLTTLSGGMGGTYIKTLGKSGKATLMVKAPGGETKRIEFTITANDK